MGTAVGYNAKATGNLSTAIGVNSEASDSDATAIGLGSKATKVDEIDRRGRRGASIACAMGLLPQPRLMVNLPSARRLHIIAANKP